MGLRDKILSPVASKIEDDKNKISIKKKEVLVSTNKRAVEGTAATTELKTIESDFKSIRHLVEYLIVKYPDIKYGKSEPIIRKYFPGQMYDAGTFMMVKLQYIRDRKLMYYNDLLKDFPNLKASKFEEKLNESISIQS
jgi:hypothetical protein